MFAWLRKLRNRGAVKEPKFVAHEEPKPRRTYEEYLAEKRARARRAQAELDNGEGYGNG